jgi:hypothetical protein
MEMAGRKKPNTAAITPPPTNFSPSVSELTSDFPICATSAAEGVTGAGIAMAAAAGAALGIDPGRKLVPQNSQKESPLAFALPHAEQFMRSLP